MVLVVLYFIESKFVRRLVRPDDECLDVANVYIPASDSKGSKGVSIGNDRVGARGVFSQNIPRSDDLWISANS